MLKILGTIAVDFWDPTFVLVSELYLTILHRDSDENVNESTTVCTTVCSLRFSIRFIGRAKRAPHSAVQSRFDVVCMSTACQNAQAELRGPNKCTPWSVLAG